MMWGSGWWILGALMMVFCVWMMSRMMSHGGSGHGGGDHGDHADGGADAERTLANRLARGEIDVEEYERLLGTLRRTESTTPT
jgi:putative membrane protein